MDEAIAKLRTEMEGNKNNPYIQVVGKFLLRHLEANPDDAEKIMVADKTIAKSLDAMKEEARKQQHNGVAMLTDAEGFAIVLRYFGIENKPIASNGNTYEAIASQMFSSPADKKQRSSDFDVKLEDFL